MNIVDEKTKLEVVKDALTATNGLIENVTSLVDTCESKLGQDYGLQQVISLLRLTHEELAVQGFFLGITEK